MKLKPYTQIALISFFSLFSLKCSDEQTKGSQQVIVSENRILKYSEKAEIIIFGETHGFWSNNTKFEELGKYDFNDEAFLYGKRGKESSLLQRLYDRGYRNLFIEQNPRVVVYDGKKYFSQEDIEEINSEISDFLNQKNIGSVPNRVRNYLVNYKDFPISLGNLYKASSDARFLAPGTRESIHNYAFRSPLPSTNNLLDEAYRIGYRIIPCDVISDEYDLENYNKNITLKRRNFPMARYISKETDFYKKKGILFIGKGHLRTIEEVATEPVHKILINEFKIPTLAVELQQKGDIFIRMDERVIQLESDTSIYRR